MHLDMPVTLTTHFIERSAEHRFDPQLLPTILFFGRKHPNRDRPSRFRCVVDRACVHAARSLDLDLQALIGLTVVMERMSAITVFWCER